MIPGQTRLVAALQRQPLPQFLRSTQAIKEPILNVFTRTAATLGLVLGTLTSTGCVIIDSERVSLDDWRDRQENNREAISNLEVGTSRTAVIDKLGTPAESEAFNVDGEELRVLFYRTHRRHSDGETSRDETTPIVFRNDALIGWGKTIYQDVRP